MYIEILTSSARIGTNNVDIAVLLVTSVANDAMRQMTNIIDQESISRKADI
jgi:hypothetical protein